MLLGGNRMKWRPCTASSQSRLWRRETKVPRTALMKFATTKWAIGMLSRPRSPNWKRSRPQAVRTREFSCSVLQVLTEEGGNDEGLVEPPRCSALRCSIGKSDLSAGQNKSPNRFKARNIYNSCSGPGGGGCVSALL